MRVDSVRLDTVAIPYTQEDSALWINVGVQEGSDPSILYLLPWHPERRTVPSATINLAPGPYLQITGQTGPELDPCIDHPSDKAYVSWEIIAQNIEVVANGELL